MHILSNTFFFFTKIGSVSDLLDYINPVHDAKGRDMAVKRKSYITKVHLGPGHFVLWFFFSSLFSVFSVRLLSSPS